jgi:hypothetical protein
MSPTLHDYDTAEEIGKATPEQIAASAQAINGVFLLDEEGDPISARDATRLPESSRLGIRTVYVDDLP